MGIGAGILGALSLGAGDFAGAFAARRVGALAVVAGAHAVGIVLLLIGVAFIRPPLPTGEVVLLGLAAGVAGFLGLAALFRGMAIGKMGLVSSLSGSASLTIPLAAGALLGSEITTLQLLGVVCVGGAAAAAGGASRDQMGRRALALAAVAAVSFGSWYVLLDLAASFGDPLWALTFSRGASALIASAIVVRRGFDRAAAPWGIIAITGVFDVAGNAFFVVAASFLAVGLAAALIGVYPVVTLLLARFLLGEHLSRLGQLGVALALVGIVLISVGG